MSERDDRTRLQHMREAAGEVVSFTAGRARADLDTDKMLLRALSMSVGMMGEAASRISEATRESAPDIPWRAIVGMRNYLFHEYFRVDRDILWDTATQSIPPLISLLDALLAENESQTDESKDK